MSLYLITRPGCAGCELARELLAEYNLAVVELDALSDPALAIALMAERDVPDPQNAVLPVILTATGHVTGESATDRETLRAKLVEVL